MHGKLYHRNNDTVLFSRAPSRPASECIFLEKTRQSFHACISVTVQIIFCRNFRILWKYSDLTSGESWLARK